MKYLILSDIHGSKPRLVKALQTFEAEKCDMLLILGDILNYGPRNSVPEGLDAKGIVALLNPLADCIVAVRGNCDAEVDQMLLHFPLMETNALLIDEGHRILLTHGHIYNKEHFPAGKFDAVMYGHTHRWELSRMDDTVILNTGSITFPKDGNPPTLALMEHGEITVRTLDGQTLKTITL
jgi:putative phosphoesterase